MAGRKTTAGRKTRVAKKATRRVGAKDLLNPEMLEAYDSLMKKPRERYTTGDYRERSSVLRHILGRTQRIRRDPENKRFVPALLTMYNKLKNKQIPLNAQPPQIQTMQLRTRILISDKS